MRDRAFKGLGLGAAVFAALYFLGWEANRTILAEEPAKAKGTLEKVFPSSNKCKRCHERVFEEWETSPLSRSIHSPAFRAALDAYLSSPLNKDNALCFRCHAPHVNEFLD